MLINSTDELKNYLPVSLQLDFSDLLPKIRMVERDVIQKKFGRLIYTHLLSEVQEEGSSEAELLQLLSEATAHLSVLEYISFGQVSLSSAGIHIHSDENTKTAFEWQVAELKDSLSKQGWSAIESALELMETLPDGALKTLWQQTDTYQAAQDSLISTLRQFQQFVHLGDSRVLFHKLLPTLNEQQEEVISEAVGVDFWQEVLSYASEQDASQKTRLAKAHRLASRALAFATVGVGFLDTLLILSDNGPLVLEGLQSSIKTSKKTAPEQLVAQIADSYAKRAEGALRELLEYCQANAENFPSYKLSPNYIADETQENHIARNDPEAGIAFF